MKHRTAENTARPLAELSATFAARHEAAGYFKLHRAILDGRLPAERRGARWWSTASNVEAYLARLEHADAPSAA